jgi:phosphodiesterase/alkaline phosphatase D-like protein
LAGSQTPFTLIGQPHCVAVPVLHSRRTVLTTAAYAAAAGAGVSAFRGFDVAAAVAPASQPASRGIFGYGVASGDPTADSLIIWTWATPPPPRAGASVATPGSGLGAPMRVDWEPAYDPEFRSLARRGTVNTNPNSDHTVKIDETGGGPL